MTDFAALRMSFKDELDLPIQHTGSKNCLPLKNGGRTWQCTRTPYELQSVYKDLGQAVQNEQCH